MSLAKLFNKQNEGWFDQNDKLTTTGIAGLTGIGGSVVTGLLANGNKSKAGEVMGKLGDAAGMIPGPIGAVASAALKTIGGLTNAAFGSNLNQQMINNIQNSANKVANTRYNASTVAGLLGEARKNSGFAGFSKKQLGTQGWWSNARDNAYNRLTALGKAAVSARDLNLTNAAQAIDTTMTNNAKRNITAFGGPLNLSGPMEYEMTNQQMSNYNIRTNAQAGNLLDNMYTGLYAFGGNIDANGANFSTGLKHVNAGGTHEESPYEGVPMGTDSEGTPNLVEENEVIYNDYVFSDRLKVPVIKVKKGQELQQFEKILRKYKGLSYAAAAKKAEVNSGVDERPNDNIARRGFEFELDILAQSQELERAIDHAETPEEKEQLRQLTPEQFAQIQAEQQAQEQAMQEQMMQQQAMQQQQQQMSPEEAAMQEQMAQMSPEEQAIMQQQMAAQQQGMSPEEAAMMQAQGYAEGGELGVPTDDQDVTGQAAQMEEAPHEQTTMFNAGTPAEEMSTSMLNETIDEIYQYAKEHKNRELLKDARKAKRGSREDKEEFVDDAREDIMMAIEEQEQLAQQQAEQEQALQQEQETQMLQQETAEETVRADAGQELDAQMQPQVFAQGGQLDDDQINQLDAFMETLKSNESPDVQKIYYQYDQLKLAGRVNEAAQLAMQVYQAATKDKYNPAKQLNSYAYGGSMSLQNTQGGNQSVEGKTYQGTQESKLDKLLNQLKYLGLSAEEVKKLFKQGMNDNQKIAITNNYITENKKKTRKYQKARQDALNQLYKSRGVKVNYLNEEGKHQYDKDLQYVYSLNDKDLKNLNLDSNVYLNTLTDNISSADDYNRAAYRSTITDKGYQIVPVTPEGKVEYNYIGNRPYQVLDDKNRISFADNKVILNGKEVILNDLIDGENGLSQYGIYDYNSGESSKFNNYGELKAYYQRKIIDPLRQQYKDSFDEKKIASYHLKGENLRNWVRDLENSKDEKDQELAKYIKKGVGDNSLDWSENATWETKGWDPKKGIIESEAYKEHWPDVTGKDRLRHDAKFGIQHYPFLNYIRPTAKRVFLNGKQVTGDFKFNELGTPVETTEGGITFYDYNLPPEQLNRYLTEGKYGDILIVPEDEVSKYSPLAKPLMADDTSKLPAGVTGTSKWVEAKPDNSAEYELPSSTPFYAGIGLQTGALINNLLTPPDYGGSDALLSKANQAQQFTPVKAEMLGNYQTYRPYDINYVNTQARNANQAGLSTIRNMYNGNVGQGMAGILANNYNYNQGIGTNYRQAMEYNDKRRNEVSEFNRATDQYNSTADLQAQEANQKAGLSANEVGLEAMARGYAMRQAIDDARSSSISNNLTGIADLLFKKYQNDYTNYQTKYLTDRGLYPGIKTK